VTAKIGQLRFDEAATDLLNDYVMNGRRSLPALAGRVRRHLLPYFGGRRMASITTAEIRAFIVERKRAGASNGEINRELTAVKRMFSLAVRAARLLTKPYVPMLREANPRTGFFERQQLEAVVRQLPRDIIPMIEFAHITGWRVASEVQPLEWRHVDFMSAEVRLDPGTTKNRDGRVFPFTSELRQVLKEQRQRTDELQRVTGTICPYVFHRCGRPIKSFIRAWRRACVAAGCPGRIPHDLRRTAVRNLVRAGVPERVAMQLTGHRTRSVFERYNIVSGGDLREAARLLDERDLATKPFKEAEMSRSATPVLPSLGRSGLD